MAASRPLNVLFLCMGNSACSIMAEGILGDVGAGRFKAYSAGCLPAGTVSPFAIELLQKNRLDTEHLRSKSWDEFAAPGAPELDYVIMVGDNVADLACPVWPGQPIAARWSGTDPAVVGGSDEAKRKAFFTSYNQLFHRLMIFVNLPLEKLDRGALKQRLDDIGHD